VLLRGYTYFLPHDHFHLLVRIPDKEKHSRLEKPGMFKREDFLSSLVPGLLAYPAISKNLQNAFASIIC